MVAKCGAFLYNKKDSNKERGVLPLNKPVYHRTCAEIDLAAIRHNFDILKAKLPPDVKVLSIVKADAYGHGAVGVARALEARTDFFAVSTVPEGVELREAGITKPILLLTYISPNEYDLLLDYDIRATVFSLADAEALSAAARKKGKKAIVHIAVDTGMGRIGFPVTEEAADDVEQIHLLPGLTVEGVFSHYATADMTDKTEAHAQTERFRLFLEYLENRGMDIPIRHICNSAGAMEFDDCFDMVRLGIALYGLFPSDEVSHEGWDLRPAMRVVSHVIHVKTVEKGTAIGYGRTYIAPEKRRIATVCIGYADGFNRAFSNKGYVLIRGKRAPVVGKVCMDQIMVDVTEIPDAAVEDEVTVLGRDGDEEITAEALGALAMSFGYEVICNFMPRVVRVYRS